MQLIPYPYASAPGRCRAPLFLVALCLALAVAGLGRPSPVSAQAPAVSTVQIGTSQGGQPLVVYRIGAGATRVLLLGGQDGGPEQNGAQLANQLLAYYTGHAAQLPPNVGVDVFPLVNPDGIAINSRQYLDGVDPNRNWGGPDWQTDAWDANAVFRIGLGGPAPFSEPETQDLRDWLLDTQPAFTVNYHSQGGFMLGQTAGSGPDLATIYSNASGYSRPQPGVNPYPYRPTGSLNVWMRTVGLPSILVELSTPTAVEYDRNLAGDQAVIAALAAS